MTASILTKVCLDMFALKKLLRPIWYKPAVVVTEGRVVKRGSISISTPSKVELLLDDDILQEINQQICVRRGAKPEKKQ